MGKSCMAAVDEAVARRSAARRRRRMGRVFGGGGMAMTREARVLLRK